MNIVKMLAMAGSLLEAAGLAMVLWEMLDTGIVRARTKCILTAGFACLVLWAGLL